VPVLGWWAAAALAGEVSIWHAYRGDERVALEAACATWAAAHPGVTVLPVYVPSEALASKIEAAVPRGNGPDLFVFAHDRIGDWSTAGVLQPVAPAEAILPAAAGAVVWEGRSWGWPLAVKTLALFRNTDLLPEAPATTDALLALGARDPGPDRFWLAWEVGKAYHAAPWMHGHGGGVFEGDAVRLDRPENAAAFALIARFAHELVPPEPSGALVGQLFNEGRVAAILNGPWFLGEIGAVPFAVSPLPVVSETGRPAAPYMTVEAAFLARPGPDAESLGRWLAGPEGAQLRQDQGRQVVASAAVSTDDPVLAAFRAQAAVAVPMPLRPEMARSWEPLDRALRRLTRGDVTPERAVAEAQSAYAILSRPAPPAADPRPYAVAFAVAALAIAAWLIRDARRAPIRRWAFAYPYVAPAFLAMTLLTVTPFWVGAAVALFDQQGASWRFVGLAHFLDILLARDFPVTSPLSFWSTLVVTIGWTVANVAAHVGIGVALAMVLREPWIRGRAWFRAALILPWAIPSYITALVWKNLFHQQFGAINALIRLVGGEPVSWFGSFWTAFAANLCTNTWLGFPFMMVVTLGALQSIPRDLEEAAEVDGASAWQRFRHVTLPLLQPALLPAVVLGSVWTFNMFNIIYLVSGGEPDGSTEILVSSAYRWAFTRGHRYGYAAAYAVIIFGVLVGYGRLANRLVGRKVV
jgi:arabinogalactan oligomer/maltooligosaccharide transport system permease protein